MKELIGYTIKSHDNGFVGKVKAVTKPFRLSLRAKHKNGIDLLSNDYVAFSVKLEEKPSEWTTLIAKDGFGIHKRYVI